MAKGRVAVFKGLSSVFTMTIGIWVGLATMGCLIGPGKGWAAQPRVPASLVGRRDAVLVVEPSGKTVITRNANTRLIPASTLKVFTALVAIHYLGADYRFPTDFFLDADSNLTVKGYGDPLLVSEALAAIARILARQMPVLHDIVLDSSFFERPIRIPGRSQSLQPYDAPNGALCANFNTVYFKYSNGRYSSAELQTPLLPFVLEKIQATGLKQERITFSQEQDDIPLYVGQLLRYFLKQQGVRITGRIRMGHVRPDQDTLIYRHHSQFGLEQVIGRMLTYSNNFIANQLLIASGAKAYSEPGTLSKGVAAAQTYARQELLIDSLPLVEGSGLSRKNRLSAAELMRVLTKFEPYHGLMRYEDGMFFKTGTLNGIHTRVGYIEKQQGLRYRFVVLLNTPGKSIEPLMRRVWDALP